MPSHPGLRHPRPAWPIHTLPGNFTLPYPLCQTLLLSLGALGVLLPTSGIVAGFGIALPYTIDWGARARINQRRFRIPPGVSRGHELF